MNKICTLLSFLLINLYAFSTVVYIDHSSAVYQFDGNIHSFDIDGDGEDDINLNFWINNLSYTCGSTNCSQGVFTLFEGINTIHGQNYINVNGNGANLTTEADDCNNDTLDINSLWDWRGNIYWGCAAEYCGTIGLGNHKQGFKIIVPNLTGGFGYIYGYLDYTLTNTGDVIIHGWYYEDQLNTPILVNSSATGINYLNTNFNIYPNPVSDYIKIESDNIKGNDLFIRNTLGQVIYTNSCSQNNITIDVSKWGRNGIYFLTIIDKSDNIIHTEKLVINN